MSLHDVFNTMNPVRTSQTVPESFLAISICEQ